jgi:DNA-binding response OmpR family regulator
MLSLSEQDMGLLVLDEELAIHDLMKLFLPEYSISTATSSGEATTYLKAHPCSLLIVEIPAPYRDRVELVGDVCLIRPSLPILAMSWNLAETDFPKAFFPTVVHWLQKPFDRGVLRDSVALALLRGRSLE